MKIFPVKYINHGFIIKNKFSIIILFDTYEDYKHLLHRKLIFNKGQEYVIQN